jgi:hypothetical protein
MAISKHKKRYNVTLTPAHVNRFQGLCKRLNLPPSTMSNAIDDLLDNISDTFQTALDKGSLEISDLMKFMGKQLELIEEEEKERKGVKQETCLKCGKPMHQFHDCALNPTATPTVEKEKKNVPEQKRRTVRNSKNAC